MTGGTILRDARFGSRQSWYYRQAGHLKNSLDVCSTTDGCIHPVDQHGEADAYEQCRYHSQRDFSWCA